MPDHAIQLDATGQTVIPGLIESNGHVIFSGQIDHARYFASRHDEYYAFGARNLEIALRQGITTIRDTMGPLRELVQLREDVDAGRIAGSRLFAAGPILNYQSLLDIPTEAELDPADVTAARNAMDLFTDFAEQGREQVRALASRGADFIKISAEGSEERETRPYLLTTEDLKSIVEEAHALGLRTTSHALSNSGLTRSLDAGFDAIEHPEIILEKTVDGSTATIMDEVVARIVEEGVFCIPLIVAMESYIRFLQTPELLDDPQVIAELPPDMVAEARRWVSQQRPDALDERLERYKATRSSLEKLISAGALIAMGTDKGTRLNYHEHANHVRELEIYIELGMSPMEAIVSASRRGAELLGVEDRIGTIEPGKQADIVIVNGDPLTDIRAIGRVSAVFKDGVRYR